MPKSFLRLDSLVYVAAMAALLCPAPMALKAEDKPNQFVWAEIPDGVRVAVHIEPASASFVNFTLTLENSSTEEVSYITGRSSENSFILSEIDKNGKEQILWIRDLHGSPSTGPREIKIKPGDAIPIPVRVPWSIFDHRITEPARLSFDVIFRSTGGKPFRVRCSVDADLEKIRNSVPHIK